MNRATRLSILAALLLGSAAAPAAAGPSALRLEGAAPLPYRINRATLASDTPILGRVEVEGVRWDGSSTPLSRAEAGAATGSLDLAFYLDEDFRSLSLRADTLAGPAGLELDLSSATGLGSGAGAEEAAARRAMRALHPPPARGDARPFSAAPLVRLEGLSLQTAAFRVLGNLGRPPSPFLMALLAASALSAALAAALPRKDGRRGRASIIACLGSSAALAAVACLAPPGPLLRRALFPTGDTSLALPGALTLTRSRNAGFELAEYGPADGSESTGEWGAALVLLPSEGGIPLEEVAPEGSLARFSPPPLLRSVEGSLLIEGGRASTGWIVRAGR